VGLRRLLVATKVGIGSTEAMQDGGRDATIHPNLSELSPTITRTVHGAGTTHKRSSDRAFAVHPSALDVPGQSWTSMVDTDGDPT
jgi:hypothetical protein